MGYPGTLNPTLPTLSMVASGAGQVPEGVPEGGGGADHALQVGGPAAAPVCARGVRHPASHVRRVPPSRPAPRNRNGCQCCVHRRLWGTRAACGMPEGMLGLRLASVWFGQGMSLRVCRPTEVFLSVHTRVHAFRHWRTPNSGWCQRACAAQPRSRDNTLRAQHSSRRRESKRALCV